jgi:hypothetical protein
MKASFFVLSLICFEKDSIVLKNTSQPDQKDIKQKNIDFL